MVLLEEVSDPEKKYKKAELGLRFCWHLDGVVAGSARPGRYGDLVNDLDFLKAQGISVIVNLTTNRLDFPEEHRAGFQEIHEPMPDGHPPERDQLERIIEMIEQAANGGRKVVVHCRGGVGRTATVLIPVLMRLGNLSLDDAITRLRKAGRYTQSMEQWEFLKSWAERI